ncbi:phosphoribosylformylglycinamidine synthase-like [Ylistrum balloti]|uniref:phosphoribosylformylglycinamidine synthase-like n=1 Tax=Ylistrum balloti TaxID=509963 RepID=UPI002905A86B|nr:phosphoribosylformylglycinamidine synthase-like [Ylistrum balloti]
MVILKLYKKGGVTQGCCDATKRKIASLIGNGLSRLLTEVCFYISIDDEDLEQEDMGKLKWILGTPFEEGHISNHSFLISSVPEAMEGHVIIEIGPRLNFTTPFSTNAVSMCKAAGLKHILRIERSVRYMIILKPEFSLTSEMEERIVTNLHDRMTQCRYLRPIDSFDQELVTEDVYEVEVMENGRLALEMANTELGLAFDDWDMDYYTKLFQETVKRNPTNVECFDLAQSNSEHSRHWFFRGRMKVDGKEHQESLFDMIKGTQKTSNDNNVIKFSDNSSGIKGFDVEVLQPSDPTKPSPMVHSKEKKRHIIFTAETHNFPTGVAPFPGATTGTGGRIRDVQAAGRGAHVVAGTAGYSFGNLHIPGYDLPWEDKTYIYPSNFARPVEIAVEGSNGASDYGNKFGEPVLTGFARSFGLTTPDGERREYVKPIMFSGGIGQLDANCITKKLPEEGMRVAKIGGPVYRIGVGGGAASSVLVQGDNKAELDFGAVQRGDPEMEQKLNRLIRACLEMGDKNPIASIHDQGAGGNGNVLKEIAEPAGALIRASEFTLGDPTLTNMELWGAEYQESNAILLHKSDRDVLETIGNRERCPVDVVGKITGDGKIRFEGFDYSEGDGSPAKKRRKLHKYPVDLHLEHVLGSMPRKEFTLDHKEMPLKPLVLPEGLQVKDALMRVLRLPSVASKRYLTNKVDRCVTGLVAQQQCVGPLHTPLADVAVTAITHNDLYGSATAIGEQPVKGLVSPAAGARMSVGEAMTNLVFALVTHRKDIKVSGNWMWPAKLPGEGAALFDACCAMCDVMSGLGVAVDGGKDSLSMAARVEGETVKAPGTLVISMYCGCPDITATVTPDLKCPQGEGTLLFVDISGGKHRLGGSALAQCYQQIGELTPDLEQPQVLCQAFDVTQKLIKDRKIISGHDVSDGGLVTCILEMAFAGNCGLDCDIPVSDLGVSDIDVLFAEELGLVLEVQEKYQHEILEEYSACNVPCYLIGHSVSRKKETPKVNTVRLSINGSPVLVDDMPLLRNVWEETSFQLERRQTSTMCVDQEQKVLSEREGPQYHVPFECDIVSFSPKGSNTINTPLRVAVLREEGSNSDREMAVVLKMAGFHEVWDINMQDLCSEAITLDQFQGLVFVGGFSYADVCGSAKGWAATALFNKSVQKQFAKFKERQDTFSLGVCNGCQLMALLGWVAPDEDQKENSNSGVGQGVLLDHNLSNRFECRFSTVKVYDSPSIMTKGMEGTTFGMWSAHGEGRMVFKDRRIYEDLVSKQLIPVRYVDDSGEPTTVYPMNPNGTEDGVGALCSEDGRHLAIMPHPERCFLPWQCPWMPTEMRTDMDLTPWYKMFINAFDWCIDNVSRNS